MLLVGMGNPIQERFIHDHRHRMDVPLVVGVGGLFDHWAGNIVRAPAWVRRAGFEWAQLLVQQPKKAGRYLVGNPVYLYRALRERVRP
jgi:N-acetylglucosaminyldiphosphoundecaprenol N-acetyl-beta-D-mannosaminyltransferase